MSTPFPLPDAVLYNLRAGHPREALRQVTDALELACGVDAQSLADLLMMTETTGGSAIGDGIAVVSCRVPVTVAAQRLCAFARLARPVAFKGVETHPCDLLFVLVSPEDGAQAHLRDLSTVIRALRDRDLAERLRLEQSTDRILNLFKARDMAVRAAA